MDNRTIWLGVGLGVAALALLGRKESSWYPVTTVTETVTGPDGKPKTIVREIIMPIDAAKPTERLQALLPYMRIAAAQWRVPISWLAAFSRQESNFKARAANIVAGDLAYGGSFGPTQITGDLARELGYAGPLPEHSLVRGGVYTGPLVGTADPAIAYDLTGKRIRTKALDKNLGLADAASIWNNGRTLAGLSVAIDILTKRSKGMITGLTGTIQGIKNPDSITPASAAKRLQGLVTSRDEYVPNVVRYQKDYAYLDTGANVA